MRLLVFVSTVALLLSGCAAPPMAPTLPGPGAISITAGTDGSAMSYVGDTVTITNAAPERPIAVTIANQGSLERTSTLTIPIGVTSHNLTLDASTLPGFDPTAEVQTFSIVATNKQGDEDRAAQGFTRALDVVKDRTVAPFPSISYQIGGAAPPGRSPWVASTDTKGADELAARFQDTVQGQAVSLTSNIIGRDRVVIPLHMGVIPSEIVLREYSLKGSFKKFFLPKELSPTGRASVVSPAAFQLVITQSEPAQLVSFHLLP